MPGDKVPGRQLLTKQTSTEKAIQRYDKSHVSSSSHSAISVWHLLIHECALIKCVSSNQDTWKKDCLITTFSETKRFSSFFANGPIIFKLQLYNKKNVNTLKLTWTLTSQETPVKFMNVFGLFAKPFLVRLYCKVTSLIFEWQVRSVPVSLKKKCLFTCNGTDWLFAHGFLWIRGTHDSTPKYIFLWENVRQSVFLSVIGILC